MHKNILNEDLIRFQDSVKAWLKKEIIPHYNDWNKAGMIPRDVYQKAGSQGFLCITQEEEYGGLGLDFRYSAVVTEEIARAGAGGLALYLHSDIVAPYIGEYGNSDQKKKYLPKMATGEFIGAIAMTEPGAGSDLQAIRTKAVKSGDEWIIDGQKTFISNGICSDVVIVVANTGESISKDGKKQAKQSLFIVESGTPGFERGRKLEKMGLHAQDTAELFFNNCRIPKENLLGQEGEAFKYLMLQLGRERLSIAIWCVANAQGVLENTIQYCKERKVFGKTVGDFQNTRFKLAELDTEISLAEALVDRTIMQLIGGEDVSISASKSKYWSSEMLGRVVDECLQFYGGYGYMDEYSISKAYTDARIQRIFGGTTEVMKEIIARSLFK